jgi:hypothetical protein
MSLTFQKIWLRLFKYGKKSQCWRPGAFSIDERSISLQGCRSLSHQRHQKILFPSINIHGINATYTKGIDRKNLERRSTRGASLEYYSQQFS